MDGTSTCLQGGIDMIKIENIDVYGFESAIRGMRNPMNSWDKSDSEFIYDPTGGCGHQCGSCRLFDNGDFCNHIGKNDLDLMKRLFKGGTEHRKYMRMINVTMDITAPLYWWKEFDTYKIGTVANSCSTMHKIHAKEFELSDFSHEHLNSASMFALKHTIKFLNENRLAYKNYDEDVPFSNPKEDLKSLWWQMIQLLPSSYNQRRTVQMNYEVAVNIIKQRKNHKLDEWHIMVDELLNLPYMKEIMGVE
jgi:hypothetical protein